MYFLKISTISYAYTNTCNFFDIYMHIKKCMHFKKNISLFFSQYTKKFQIKYKSSSLIKTVLELYIYINLKLNRFFG